MTTFGVKVRRIRFLGLFDTVNSVPKFEAAWMQRSKYPYTARSSAKVIRHAVAINERRAKFRQDLITSGQLEKGDDRPQGLHRDGAGLGSPHQQSRPGFVPQGRANGVDALQRPPLPVIKQPPVEDGKENFQDAQTVQDATSELAAPVVTSSTEDLARPMMTETSEVLEQPRTQGLTVPLTNTRMRRESMAEPVTTKSTENLHHHATSNSREHVFHNIDSHPHSALPHKSEHLRGYSAHKKSQDIDEVWFLGGHGDIGGGWAKAKGEKWQLCHTPLGKSSCFFMPCLRYLVKAGYNGENLLEVSNFKTADFYLFSKNEMPPSDFGASLLTPRVLCRQCTLYCIFSMVLFSFHVRISQPD